MSELKQELENFIDAHLPAVQRLEFKVEAASEKRVILSAPLAANINDKLTAFGASQQMLGLSCAWSLVYLNMVHAGLKEQQYVVAEVQTHYRKPVASEVFYAISEQRTELSEFTSSAGKGVSSRTKNLAWILDQENMDRYLESTAPLSRTPTSQDREVLAPDYAATTVEALFATTKN